MADEVYDSFGEALSDFQVTEGDQFYDRLIAEIQLLHAEGRFPPLADIRAAYSDPFWKNYDRIIAREDVALSSITLRDLDKDS